LIRRQQAAQRTAFLDPALHCRNPAGQVTSTSYLADLRAMAPEEAAQVETFTINNPDNSTTVYRVGGSACAAGVSDTRLSFAG
jgi:hypothetical protein